MHHAPEDLLYAKNRYLKEVERHYRVLDQRQADHQYLAGDTYSIADMALSGWANYAPYILGQMVDETHSIDLRAFCFTRSKLSNVLSAL